MASDGLKELQAQLAEIEANAVFVSLASRLRPRLGAVLNWAGGGDEISLARSFIDRKDARMEGVLGPLLVQALAALERYLRQLVEEAVRLHGRRSKQFDQLSDHLRKRNVALTGSLLATVDSPRSHITLSLESLIANLASCTHGSSRYVLNAGAFGAAVSGAAPAAFEKALANVGVKDWWDRVGGHPPLQSLLGTKGPRETGKGAETRLDELWRWRCQLAHGGDEPIALNESELLAALAFVGAFSEALDGIALADLA